ncbi:transmembrane protease serine 11B-like [Drosophila tropicalis]|uniref:transmembrane protease serine 11B-like n=1 Tax=Drosophila tropicalis TaxID=46794 RepID=UPI0035AC126C
MVGDIPGQGQPYQIIRIIEYLVPYSPKKTARTKEEDSLEIIPADIDSLLKLKPTKKPKKSLHFLVKVLRKNATLCTGALISRRLVLSSSQCLAKKAKPTDYNIQASRSRRYKIVQLIFGSGLAQDLVLIVLKAAIHDAAIQPIRLCDGSLKPLENVTMYMSRKRLSFLRTQVIANGACKRSYAQDENVYITANMLCVQNTGKLQDCQTAKGDLLLHKDHLCGINIYGSHCVNGATNGDLYANIFKARDYLQRMIKQFV